MNPLPNRPLLNNTTLPLQLPNLPNVPAFDQMAFNGRPRKVMPEVGKDLSMLNGIGMMTSPSSAPAATGPQVNPLDRGNFTGSVSLPSQQHSQGPSGPQSQQMQQQQQAQQLQPASQQAENKEKEGETEPHQLTAIFRPEDANMQDKMRMSHEFLERVGHEATGQSGPSISGAASWERRNREDDEDGKEEDAEVEDEDSSVIGEGDGAKVWKAKRTLRKLVFD